MAKLLILYGTSEGHTVEIVNKIAHIAELKGHRVAIQDLKESTPSFSLEGFDAVVIGASIHASKYQPYVKEFVKTNAARLGRIPSAFFSVCLTTAQPGEVNQLQVKQYIEQFLKDTDWQPLRIGSFGGALLYTKYGFFKQFLMKTIAKRGGSDTDTSRNYDYTDWTKVAEFAEEFLNASELVKPLI